MSINSILNNSLNITMKIGATSSPLYHNTNPADIKSSTYKCSQKSNLKKAMSTPSIIEKIKLEDCDNVFYETNYEKNECSSDYNDVIQIFQ